MPFKHESVANLGNVINMLDCAVVKIVFKEADKRTVLWANDAFYKLTGSNPDEYANEQDHGDPRKVLHPDDFERVFAAFHEHAQTKERLNIQYRVFNKEGGIVWIDVISNFLGYEQGYPCFINVMQDISEKKRLEAELALEHERYKVISELSSDLLFEYNFEDDSLYNHFSTFKLISHDVIHNFFAKDGKGLIHPDHIDIVRQAVFEDVVQKGSVRSSVPFLVKFNDEEYHWVSFSGAMIGKRLVGRLNNIDKEVKLFDDLKQKAQLDPMTGLLNKGATLSLIETLMENSLRHLEEGKLSNFHDHDGSQDHHALVVLDIDNFKGANDNFGHIFGDQVICAVANTLKQSFRDDDIVGRVGGDEFLVLLRNVNAKEAIKRIAQYRTNLQENCSKFADRYKVTNSIGIAMFPQYGKSFVELFESADHALYQAKERGKNCAVMFEG